ncbi:MAG: septum formation initiator family protein [Clostridia bacterium]|nr:septum formation initiator family protein [Clostridia bacterium]
MKNLTTHEKVAYSIAAVMTALFLATVILALVLMGSLSEAKDEARDLANEQAKLNDAEAELRAQKEEFEEKIDRLKEELAHPMTDDYVMRIAREKLGYYLPDEVIFYNDR